MAATPYPAYELTAKEKGQSHDWPFFDE